MLEVQPADGAGGVAESIRALVAEPYRVWGAAGPDTVEDDDHRSTSHGSSSSDEYTGYHAVNQVRQAGGEALEMHARLPSARPWSASPNSTLHPLSNPSKGGFGAATSAPG